MFKESEKLFHSIDIRSMKTTPRPSSSNWKDGSTVSILPDPFSYLQNNSCHLNKTAQAPGREQQRPPGHLPPHSGDSFWQIKRWNATAHHLIQHLEEIKSVKRDISQQWTVQALGQKQQYTYTSLSQVQHSRLLIKGNKKEERKEGKLEISSLFRENGALVSSFLRVSKERTNCPILDNPKLSKIFQLFGTNWFSASIL